VIGIQTPAYITTAAMYSNDQDMEEDDDLILLDEQAAHSGHHQQHQVHAYSKSEKRRRVLERELRDLQAEFPSSNAPLSREERRVAAAQAAKERREARTRDETSAAGTTGGSGKSRGRGRMPAIYDDNGIHKQSGQDVCDCLNPDCVGCHFPCKGCGSKKCGRKCRVQRKWMYTQVIEQLPYDESIVLRTKKV
jgi:hypothetical protein